MRIALRRRWGRRGSSEIYLSAKITDAIIINLPWQGLNAGGGNLLSISLNAETDDKMTRRGVEGAIPSRMGSKLMRRRRQTWVGAKQ